MLEFANGTITETAAQNAMAMTAGASGSIHNGSCVGGSLTTGSTYGGGYTNYPIYWQSYPIYICSDKTKKAIEVLKALQAEKLLKCESVPRFIELVEKISGLL